MTLFKKLILSTCILLFSGTFSEAQNIRVIENFNKNWKFSLNSDKTCIAPGFNDASWRTLNLPHDWSIEGEFSEKNPATPGGGALPGGIGWYRKSFIIPASNKDKLVYIEFDGVYRNSEVWINSHFLGFRPFGYITFRYEMSKYLNYDGKPNTLVVKVDNSKQPNSRWYSGSGIYRNVKLVTTSRIAVAQWGTHIETPEVSAAKAKVTLTVNISGGGTGEKVMVRTNLVDKFGKTVATNQSELQLNDTLASIVQEFELKNPVLWSIENPYLYTALTQVLQKGKLIDNYSTTFATRYFEFNANEGFILNGKHVKIKGVCNHHDLGCLGSAINVSALHRQLSILKEMGVNGIRTSHNPPAPELLNLCDTMGFIVMDEAFDMWRKRKSPFDYAQYFNDWHERDLTDMLLRDRNHPSIFMWSIGNEVLEQWNDVKADTMDLKEANLILNFAKKIDTVGYAKGKLNLNSAIAAKLVSIVKDYDKSRPVTSGNNEPGPWNNIYRSGALDLIGYNYHESDILNVPKNFPGKPFVGTENVSALMTRGYYRMPSDSMFIWPERWDKPFSDPSYSCSAYDNCHAPWGSTHEDCWKVIKKYPYISGMYIWTGFDYLGEPTPYWWPARSSYFGIVDLAGFPKDVYYMYQSEWTDKPMLHIFPHWNWKPGEMVDVWAYYNNADEVELFVNGSSAGIKKKPDDVFHVFWRVPFEPGSIKVISRKNGKEVLTKEIKTAGTPASIDLIPHKNWVKADGDDLDFVTVRILDANGNLVPNAENLVKFEVNGEGTFEAVDNGSPISSESFKVPQRKAFYGLCLLVVRPTEKEGKINIKATSEGLKGAVLEIPVK